MEGVIPGHLHVVAHLEDDELPIRLEHSIDVLEEVGLVSVEVHGEAADDQVQGLGLGLGDVLFAGDPDYGLIGGVGVDS